MILSLFYTYNIYDDWHFLFTTTYHSKALLFLNCLANLVVPSYVISMVACMSRYEFEVNLRIFKTLSHTSDIVIQKIKFAFLDLVNLTILMTGR